MPYSVSKAFLASKVYDTKTIGIGTTLTAPDGTRWELALKSPESSPTDYQGSLFKNPDTGKYEFVSRGTEITSAGDLKADIQMGLGRLPSQMQPAEIFLSRAKDYINDKGGNPSTDLSLIGHSLGASITQVLAAKNPDLQATTFNAYGVGNLMPEG